MSIQSEITRITNNVQDTIDVIEQTGVSVPAGANSDNLPSLAQALANEKQDKLTGQQGQVVGFNASGEAVAQAAPQAGITQSQADARYLQLSGGTIEVPARENGSPSVALRLRNTGNSSSANRHDGPYFEFETPDGEIVREYINFDDGHAVVYFYDAENDDFVVLSGLLDPVNGADAATKYYVDSKRPKPEIITLTAAGWSSNTQTATVNGVSATETDQLIQPAPALASQSAYYAAGILCTGQAENQLTFTCTTVPTEDLTVYVVIQEVRA